jgi:alpha-tubulin suppressor-like RCC1 family protein
MNFAQTFEDEVYLWENESKLTKLVMKKVNIVSVACGEKFSLILSQQGVVFSFGKCNKFGQLGNGNRIPRYTPEPVSDLINIGEKVSQISCGYKHCVVKCTSGKAFSWGLVK